MMVTFVHNSEQKHQTLESDLQTFKKNSQKSTMDPALVCHKLVMLVYEQH